MADQEQNLSEMTADQMRCELENRRKSEKEGKKLGIQLMKFAQDVRAAAEDKCFNAMREGINQFPLVSVQDKKQMQASVNKFEEKYKSKKNRKWIFWCLFAVLCIVGGCLLFKFGLLSWITKCLTEIFTPFAYLFEAACAIFGLITTALSGFISLISSWLFG